LSVSPTCARVQDGFASHYAVDFFCRNESFVGGPDEPYLAIFLPPVPRRAREGGQGFGLLEGIGTGLQHLRTHARSFPAKDFRRILADWLSLSLSLADSRLSAICEGLTY
jgi:hypothetical protein